MSHFEKTVRRNTVYEGKIFNVRRDDALLEGGKPCIREIVEHPGGAAVLCVREGKVAFVRQFRYAYGEELLEIPAGKLERGEDPAAAALRELGEETGLIAEKVSLKLVLYPTPGYTNEKIYIYEAENVREGEVHPDEDEFLDLVFLPLKEAYSLLDEGKLHDGKTVAALWLYRSAHPETA